MSESAQIKMDINTIKTLREETGAGVMDAKSALEQANGDVAKAKEILKAKGVERAEKKSDREIKAGRIFSYIHSTGTVGSLLKLGCETDYVAKNDEFIKVGNEIAMHYAAMGNDDTTIETLLEEDYIRDTSKKIKDLITAAIAKTGENITLAEVKRYSI